VTVEIAVPTRVSGEAREALEIFAARVPPAGREHLDARARRSN
jgi:molecular chaperone DnaJ